MLGIGAENHRCDKKRAAVWLPFSMLKKRGEEVEVTWNGSNWK